MTMTKWMSGLMAMGVFLSMIGLDASAGIVGYWNFDDNVEDQTNNGNDGTIVGTPTYSTSIPGGLTANTKSIEFGGNDYVNITQNSMLPINTSPAFTVAMWVKGSPQSDKRIFSEGTDANNNGLFNLGTENGTGTGKFDLFVRNDSGGQVAPHQKSEGTPFDGTWHHVAWVDVDNAGTREGTLYIDGVADSFAFSYADAGLTSVNTTVGAILRSSICCGYTGNIDDVAIWNEALTSAEVTLLASGTSPLAVPEPSTWLLAALGTLGLIGFVRRRK